MNDRVLSEFVDAWNAGRRPRVRDYLARLPDGPERDALADRIDTWLSIAPTPAYADRAAVRAEVAARLAAPLGEARRRAGLSLRELALRLQLGDVERTQRYLERLEAGTLDASRVSRRVLDALGALLGVPGASLRAPSVALFRGEGEDVRDDLELLSRAAFSPAPAPMDELDRLFTGGPDA